MIRDPSDGSVMPAETVEQLQAEVARQDRRAGLSDADREAIAALRGKYGQNWGLKSLDQPVRKPKPAPTIEELRDHYAKFKLAFEPKEGE